MAFKKPDGLLGRFAVVKPWPDVQAAEDENIARLQITARSLGLDCVVVDPEGQVHRIPFHRVREVYRNSQRIWRRPDPNAGEAE